MAAKALSFTEVVEQVADNAEDVYQNYADKYLSGPEEERIESETENTQSAAYALQAALKSSTLPEFIEPNCYISSNRKAAVISFTSLKSVINLFTIICGYTEMEVRKYCSRSLKSKGNAELIVNKVKDFAFIYKYKKGQFIISFNFGIWNPNGFPQHT
ncbi:Hypothetical predicted protein [Paramuricea clavata]|uniref:Uncharacterized protein n=1 Tax=Paramuricea clavata TaxID=317549 RepID=A0A6S7IIQ9_PARCT|nr:Hypothetical predicted protein [Paramuricea clavata]